MDAGVYWSLTRPHGGHPYGVIPHALGLGGCPRIPSTRQGNVVQRQPDPRLRAALLTPRHLEGVQELDQILFLLFREPDVKARVVEVHDIPQRGG